MMINKTHRWQRWWQNAGKCSAETDEDDRWKWQYC